MTIYRNYIKRVLDVFLALLALPFLCLLILVIAPWIWLGDRGPVFYLAKRRGLKGEPFNMIKFRSMDVDAPDIRNVDNSTFSSQHDPRVTPVGRILRKTSLDELPQIFNVLRGDMSWIGPRASIPREGMEYSDLSEERRRRLSVRPGITGYTAALYRNSIEREEKLRHDLYYVEHMSFVLDVKIFFWTIASVLGRKNLYTNE
ncbi:MAG: sugar transferase [Clostridiales bacterium]|nr:sugar transferase [Clostridiales bacterium]